MTANHICFANDRARISDGLTGLQKKYHVPMAQTPGNTVGSHVSPVFRWCWCDVYCMPFPFSGSVGHEPHTAPGTKM